MLREEVVVSILRFYPESTDDPLAKFTASCTLLWESHDVVWVKALTGTLSRSNLKAFLKFILDKNIRLVKAIRANESLPFATKQDGNYCEIDVELRKERFQQILRG